jgi:hypothetical protein
MLVGSFSNEAAIYAYNTLKNWIELEHYNINIKHVVMIIWKTYELDVNVAIKN